MSKIEDESGTEYEIIETDNDDDSTNILNEVLGELGVEGIDDIMLKIYRINDMGKEAHCFDCLPDALNGIEDRLRNSYGKGDYKIKVYAPNVNGRKSIKKHIKLSIEVPIDNAVEKVADNSSDLSGMLTSIMGAMQDSQKDMFQMMQTNALEQQNKNQEMMITLLSNKNDKPEVSIVEQLALLKQLMPEPEKPVDPMTMFSTMMDMHKTAKDEFADNDGGGSTMGELTKGLNSLVSLAANAPPKTQPVAQPEQRPAPQENTQKQTELRQQVEQDNSDMNPLVKMKLKSHLNHLIEKARQKKDAELWVEVTLDEIPEQFYPTLIESLGDDSEQAYASLKAINPAIEEFKPWFIEFCTIMRDAFSEADTIIKESEGLPDLTDEAQVEENTDTTLDTENIIDADKHTDNENPDNGDT